MQTEIQNKNNFLNIKSRFNSLISENFTNWKLVLFWIILFELFATMFEYAFIGHSVFSTNAIEQTLTGQFIIGITFTAFIWMCVHTFIFWNKTNFLFLVLFGALGLYLTITHDLYFDFLMTNLNPVHLFDMGFSFAVVIEFVFKLIIVYLIYQLVMTFKKIKA